MATGNTDGYNRDIFVKVVKNETLQEILFYINQDGGLITFDITNLTMDSTLITFDNG
jgi:NADPH:quinone reductase-like Zn-dependent oxidoreductase